MKNDTGKISRDNFIDFLATSSPEEINEFIKREGKPRKPIIPIVFFNDLKSADKAK